MNPPQIKIVVNGDELISPEVKNEAESLVLQAQGIKTISTVAEDSISAVSVVAMRKHVKAQKEFRLSKTRVLDDAIKVIKDYFDKHCEPLENEINRLQKLGNIFAESERQRVAAEEKKRRDEFEAAQRAQFALDEAARKAAESGTKLQQLNAERKLDAAKANVQSIIATPEPEAEAAKGKSTKQVLKWEVTDIYALVKARPDLCKIEAKASAINASCNPAFPVPGLKLEWETKTTYSSR